MSELIEELREHERDYPSLIHGPLCGRAADEIEALVKALEFYGDPSRYDGPNQRLVGDDPYTPKDQGYRQDVTRDGGKIARDMLASVGGMPK